MPVWGRIASLKTALGYVETVPGHRGTVLGRKTSYGHAIENLEAILNYHEPFLEHHGVALEHPQAVVMQPVECLSASKRHWYLPCTNPEAP